VTINCYRLCDHHQRVSFLASYIIYIYLRYVYIMYTLRVCIGQHCNNNDYIHTYYVMQNTPPLWCGTRVVHASLTPYWRNFLSTVVQTIVITSLITIPLPQSLIINNNWSLITSESLIPAFQYNQSHNDNITCRHVVQYEVRLKTFN